LLLASIFHEEKNENKKIWSFKPSIKYVWFGVTPPKTASSNCKMYPKNLSRIPKAKERNFYFSKY